MTLALDVRPVRHGPTSLPRYTLAGPAMKWAAMHLQQPDRTIAGAPWAFTREQMFFMAWFYAIDEDGNFLKTYIVLRRLKGWGKDPIAAVISAIEFIGPCRFAGWDREHRPIVVPQPSAWVQIAAVSKEQTRNTMTLFPSLFTKKTIQEYKLDIGKEIIYAEAGQRQIQAVTSSPRTLEGARSTLVILNETQHWLPSNEGTDMAKVIRRNNAKTGGRGLAITNAHRIGEGSVAEQDWLKYVDDGDDGEMLYDSTEAPEDTDIDNDESLRAGLVAARGDSTWLSVDRLMIDCRDVRDDEPLRRRYYLNQLREEKGTWVTASEWSATERVEQVAPGTLITLGFDGSRFRDATGLVGTVVKTGYQWVLAVWARSDLDGPDWEVPEAEVNLAVEEAFRRYKVCRMYCDPWWWEETIAKWMGRWGEDVVVFFYTNTQLTKMARALKNYETAVRISAKIALKTITEEELAAHQARLSEEFAEKSAETNISLVHFGHEPSAVFADHINNAVKHTINIKDEDGEPMYVIAKENKNSPKKIDLSMAGVLSWQAMLDAVKSGAAKDTTSVYETRGFRRV